jgi:hypothetical protein
MRIVLATFPSPSPFLSLSYLARVRPRGRSPVSARTHGRSAGLPLPLPLLSSPSPSPVYVERPRRPADVAQMRTHPRPRLYNPRPHLIFLLFLSFAFGWSCGICLATPISTCKGRRDHKHFEGDPLAFFAKQKFKGCIYPLDACVFSYAGVYVKIFKRRCRRN